MDDRTVHSQPPSEPAGPAPTVPLNALDLFPREELDVFPREETNAVEVKGTNQPPAATARGNAGFAPPPASAQARPATGPRPKPPAGPVTHRPRSSSTIGRVRGFEQRLRRRASLGGAFVTASAIWMRQALSHQVVPRVRRSSSVSISWVRGTVLPRIDVECRRLLAGSLRAVRSDQLDHYTSALPPIRLVALSATMFAVALAGLSFGGGQRQPVVSPSVGTQNASVLASLPAAADQSTEPRPVESENPTPVPAAPSIEPTRASPKAAGVHPAGRGANSEIQSTLNRYRDGFSTLDIAEIKAVWPTVDEPGLNKLFATLYDQNVEFETCNISVAARRATALCRGSVSYVLSGRSRRRFTEGREWRFTLRESRGQWLIATVASDLPSRAAARSF